MKSLFIIATLITISTNSFASGPRMANICESLASSKLPGGCKAVCKISEAHGGESSYEIIISKMKEKVTSPSFGEMERMNSQIEGEVMIAQVADDLAGYELLLKIDSNDNVLYLKVNNLECK